MLYSSAFRHYLDDDTKREYLEANEKNPELVETETPLHKFLAVEDNNPWQAARRLALYWKYRKEIMGDDRWLLPMTQTGKGALGDAEVNLLRRGIYNYTCTEETGPVVVVDGYRNQGCDSIVSGRILFYLGTVLDDEEIRTKGISVVFAVTSADTVSHINPRFGLYISQGLPAKVRRFVVVQNHEPNKESLVQFFAERRKLQINIDYKQDCDVIASNKSQVELLQLVGEAGLPWKALPTSCGGLFDNSVLSEWIRKRISLEDIMSCSSPKRQIRSKRRRKRKAIDTKTEDIENAQKVQVVATMTPKKRTKHNAVETEPFNHPKPLSIQPQAHYGLYQQLMNGITPAPVKQQQQNEVSLDTIWAPLPLTIENDTLDPLSFLDCDTITEEDLDFGYQIFDPLDAFNELILPEESMVACSPGTGSQEYFQTNYLFGER